MKWIVPLWIAEAVFTALFILAGHPIPTKKSFYIKMAACALYVANAAAAYSVSAKSVFGLTVLCGIIGGLVGDIFLASLSFVLDKQNPKLYFLFALLGGILFFAGHIAYIAAFVQLLHTAQAFRFLPFAAIGGGMLLIFALLLKITDIHAGKYTFPVAIYACALTCMFSLGMCTALFAIQDTLPRCILFAAPTLFVCSDITLALKTIDRQRFGSLGLHTFSLGCYFLAQMLFGTAILLL